jgi:hypothetical protein
MADPIEEILRELKDNPRVQDTRFRANFLNNVAEVYSRDGPGAAKVFLLARLDRRRERHQAQTLLDEVLPVLDRSDKIRHRPAIGAFIIKTLDTLRRKELSL